MPGKVSGSSEPTFVATNQGEEVHVDGEPLRWSSFLRLLTKSAPFRRALTTRLRDDAMDAFYFECVPWFAGTDPVFRFVLVAAPRLRSRAVDERSFSEHFAKGHGRYRTFKNLRGDSTLVVPAPEGSSKDFGHLASWLRAASEAQADEVWRAVAAAIEAWRPSGRPLWLSTSGGGVAWVHLRLDPRPKYYKHAAFRSLTAAD